MYHLVWLPKYRRKVLEGKVKKKVGALLYQCAEVNGWEIKELNIQPNHVHMMIQLPPSISVSKAVQLLKGTSSKMIRAEHLPAVKEFLWGKDFWADGYFCETVGTISEEAIKLYIQNQ
jgi:putative transposase